MTDAIPTPRSLLNMASISGQTSSTPGTPNAENSLSWYKSQYEQLEAELADFQASSKELEAELEKDVEAAEQRERQLKEKVEGLGYEAEEWKVSCLKTIFPLQGVSNGVETAN